MNPKPLNNNIVIQELAAPTVSAGGIVLPPSAQKERGAAVRAKVLAVGSGRRIEGTLVPIDVAVGDTVVVDPASHGAEVTLNGEKVLILDADFVLGVVNG